jgi:hypothetical protein
LLWYLLVIACVLLRHLLVVTILLLMVTLLLRLLVSVLLLWVALLLSMSKLGAHSAHDPPLERILHGSDLSRRQVLLDASLEAIEATKSARESDQGSIGLRVL